MRRRMTAALAGAIILFACRAEAADGTMTIAVFTKNTTNPAYQAFRIAADQIGRSAGMQIQHFVPKQPDNVDEQQALVEQVLKDRPDAVVFIPVDDVAMVDSVRKLNQANIPVVLASNPLPGNSSSMSAPTITRSDIARRVICSKSLGTRARSSSSRARRALPPTASGCAVTNARLPNILVSRCLAPSSVTISRRTRSV
jgi:hypothetical protein